MEIWEFHFVVGSLFLLFSLVSPTLIQIISDEYCLVKMSIKLNEKNRSYASAKIKILPN